MSRRRKGQRKQGGRVTPRKSDVGVPPDGVPPDGVPGPDLPRIGGSNRPAGLAPPPITKMFEPVLENTSPERDDHPADIEQFVAEFVGIVTMIADDAPMPGDSRPSRPSDLTGMAPAEDAEEMLTSAVLELADNQRFRTEARYVDCIRPAIPFCDRRAKGELERRVAQLEAKVGAPKWAGAVWNATAVGGWHSFDTLGDISNVGVELSWPGDWPTQVLFGSIVVEGGPFLQEFVVTSMDEYRQTYAPGTPWPADPDEPPCRADVMRHLEPMDPAEAVGRLKRAMSITNMMIDAPTAPDYFMYAPFARQTLADLPSVDPPEQTWLGDEAREQLIREFLNAEGVAFALGFEDDPGFAQEVGEFCELFIDYAERYAGGDVYRWSPMVVGGFLHYYGDKVISDGETDELLESVLREWMVQCHRRRDWPESVTRECMIELDEHLAYAIGEAGADAGGSRAKRLSRLATEVGTVLDDPGSLDDLMDTWNANESWPAGEAAPMPWARIPEEAVSHCRAVLEIAEPVLNRLFAPGHVTSARRMVSDLAVQRTPQFLRGRADVWAAAVTYAVAQIHRAFDYAGGMFGCEKRLTPQQLIDAFPTVSKASMTSKATTVRDWLDADRTNRPRYLYIVPALRTNLGLGDRP